MPPVFIFMYSSILIFLGPWYILSQQIIEQKRSFKQFRNIDTMEREFTWNTLLSSVLEIDLVNLDK